MGRGRKSGLKLNGWIILDKPLEMTSTSAVNKVRYLLNANKAGHGGTLDPLATGILPIALGEATKTINHIQDGQKTYHFTVTWGQATDTDDAEGDVIETHDHRPVEKDIIAILPNFTGLIEQVPPKFSAIKINGERAYDLARAGKPVEMKSRSAMIYDIQLIKHDNDTATFEVLCGKGTYMRSLARDIALKLGTVGHVTYLRRLKVGVFDENMSISLDDLEKRVQDAPADTILHPVETALDDIPDLALTPAEAARLRNGQAIQFISRADIARLHKAGIETPANDCTALAKSDDTPIAVVAVMGVEIRPVRVLNL